METHGVRADKPVQYIFEVDYYSLDGSASKVRVIVPNKSKEEALAAAKVKAKSTSKDIVSVHEVVYKGYFHEVDPNVSEGHIKTGAGAGFGS